jgi:CheY-like chemotaxis protein
MMSNILIVEDSDSARAQMEMMVQELNHSCVTVSNGREALDLLRGNFSFDLVITDIFMPEMDGIETIEQIMHTFPSMRIIAVSAGGMGMSGTGMLEIASGMGASAILNKPFVPELFKKTIQEALVPKSLA